MSPTQPPAVSSLCPTCSRAYGSASEALERAHSLLLAALEATADGILVVDLEGRTVAHNRRFLEMWGIPAERMGRDDDEALRRRVLDQVEDPEGFTDRVRALYADREARSADTLRMRDGRVFERYSQPQRLEGEVVGRVWSFRDVTERVAAEEELRSRERQLAETQRLARLGSWRWDVPENRVAWSDELYRIYGLEPEAFGASFEAYLARVHPDDVAEVKARLGQVLEEGGRFEFEERVLRPDGSVRVLRSMGKAMLDPGGRPLRLVGACHDITEQRAAEDARRHSESRFRTVFEQFPLGIHILAPDGRTLEVNRAWDALYGVRPEALEHFNPLTDPRFDDVREFIERGFAGEPVVVPARPFPRPAADGVTAPEPEILWIQAYICPVKDEVDDIAEVIAVHQDVTESRRAAEALAASEASYRAIFDASTDAVYVHDLETGAILDVNRRACELHGRTREEFIALGLAALDAGEAPFDADAAAARIRAAASGERQLFEWQAPHVDGRRTWLEVGLRKVMIGGRSRLLANARDITDRKNAEIALQAANEALEGRVAERTAELAETNLALKEEIAERARAEEELLHTASELEAVFQALPDGYFRVDAAGTVLDYRPGAFHPGPSSLGEVVGRRLEEVCPAPIAAELREATEVVRLTGAPTSVEYALPGAGGARELEARLVPFGDGEAIAIVRDVTESRRSERELQRSEEHFRTLIENGSDLIIVVDPEGKTAYLSPSGERILGWPPEERLGRSSFEMIHPDDVPAAAARRQEAVDHPGRAVSVEFRYRHRDGGWRAFEALVRTLLPDSAAAGLVVNARDVTSRRAAQEALERAMAEAEQANRAKSEFLSRMSHELRTPMNSILGFAQLLAKRATGEDQVRAVDHILKAGRHLLNLINEVLDISRIEANRQHLSLEAVRVDGAVHEAVNLIRPLAAQQECRVDDPGPLAETYVMADRQRLAQVLLNLLSNAVKYNRPGGRVWITVDPLDPAEGDAAVPGCRIGVHDTGPGIPAERMEELFVPFSRLGADLTGVEGTGLGLALSKRLVEAMDGRLEVRSTPGVGSTFSVILEGAANPLHRLGVEAAAATPRAEARVARPATLLYIEDNLANLTLIETILAGRPEITLVPALQGRLGIDLACQHGPDLILLDLHLPDIPGDEVLARLREGRTTQGIPVVVISADATPGRIERLRGEGVAAYLTKPLDVDEFLDTVDAVLAQREG
jgi:PAS domain S-box-containing protein